MTMREVLYDGTTTGNQIDVQNNWWVMGADPGGGLVVNPYGLGVYHVDAEGSHRIADGISEDSVPRLR